MKITERTITLIDRLIASYNVWAKRTRSAVNADEHKSRSEQMFRKLHALRGMMDLLNTMDSNNSYRLEFATYGMFADIIGVIKTSTTGKESYIIKH